MPEPLLLLNIVQRNEWSVHHIESSINKDKAVEDVHYKAKCNDLKIEVTLVFNVFIENQVEFIVSGLIFALIVVNL